MTVDDSIELFYRAAHAETDSKLAGWYTAKTGRAGPVPPGELGSLDNRLQLIIIASTPRIPIQEALRAMGEAFQAAGMVAEAKEYLHELCEGLPPYPVDVQMRSGILIEGVRSDIWDEFRKSMRLPERAIGLCEPVLRKVSLPPAEHLSHRCTRGREVTPSDRHEWEHSFDVRVRKMKRDPNWHRERTRWLRLQQYALEDYLDLTRRTGGIAGNTLSVIDIAPNARENEPKTVIGNVKRDVERAGVKLS